MANVATVAVTGVALAGVGTLLLLASRTKAATPGDPWSDPLLVSLQHALSEAQIAVNAGYPDNFVMVPGMGLQYASVALQMLPTMIEDRKQELGL